MIHLALAGSAGRAGPPTVMLCLLCLPLDMGSGL